MLRNKVTAIALALLLEGCAPYQRVESDTASSDDLEVVVLVEVGTDGRATRATIDRSSGNPTIDEHALSAVRRAQLRPYVKDGVAMPAKAKIPFIFKKP